MIVEWDASTVPGERNKWHARLYFAGVFFGLLDLGARRGGGCFLVFPGCVIALSQVRSDILR